MKASTLDTPTRPSHDTLPLVEIIELKWLMSGMGMRVHVEKLQADREYALRTLAMAESSPNEALRVAAGRLRSRLGMVTA